MEEVIGVDVLVIAFKVAERPNRPRDEDPGARHLTRLASELHAALDDLLEPVVEKVRRELAAVGAERVGLDHLCAGADEAHVHLYDGFRRLEVRLLRAAEAGDASRKQRAGPAVPDDDRPFREPLQRSAHRG